VIGFLFLVSSFKTCDFFSASSPAGIHFEIREPMAGNRINNTGVPERFLSSTSIETRDIRNL
jgi:hypothetical protein